MNKKSDLNFNTKVIHVGGEPDPVTGSIMPPIHQTSTYVQSSPGKHKGYEYSRSHNPTRTRLEDNLASLEKAKFALVTSSGMAAISLILHTVPTGSYVLSGDDVYGGTNRILNKVFNDSIKTEFVDSTDLKEVEAGLKKFKPYIFWLETPTNPMLKISDIAKISKLCKKYKAILVVDNTFMSPCFQNPLELGADIVTHSMTKYINGHSDSVGGAIMLNSKSIYDKLWFLQNSIGPSLPPFDSWLILRGIKTLGLRMERHEKNALELAKFLETQKNVEKVIYPGLKSHPQHRLAKKQMSGFSGMISIYIKGGLKETNKFLKKLKVFKLAESLGGVESLVNHPAIMTHASVPLAMRKKLGISSNLIRLSVGIEDIKDLKEDLKNSLT